MASKKTCYYDVLELDKKCDTAEIKTSYRKLALKLHPDKAHMNGFTVEDATARFQKVQEAYSVLSDAQERAWYDSHRDQILRGDDETGEDPFKTRINMYKYFSSGCYEGFGDGIKGFYAVYGELFEAIDREEKEWEDADEAHTAMPVFATSNCDWADVSNFYRHWLDFCSRKAFGHADKWNPKDAPNRQVRRAMEQDNKKLRQAAKKDFNAEVRHLVSFVQKRDPRVQTHQKEQMKESVEKKQKEIADKAQSKAREEKEKKARQEAARQEEEARWAEAQALRKEKLARGEVVSEDDSSSESETLEYRCEPCRKSFKSEKQFDQHCKSKKHVQLVAQLRRDLEKEMEDELDEEDDSDSSDSEEEGSAGKSGAAQKKADDSSDEEAADGRPGNAACKAKEVESEDDESEDDEDALLARFAGGKFRPPERQGATAASSSSAGVEKETDSEKDSDSDSDKPNTTASAFRSKKDEKKAKQKALLLQKKDDIVDDAPREAAKPNNTAGLLGGKKEQKREQQKALLLEKKAQKDSVQELVSNCKKAEKATNKLGQELSEDAATGNDEAETATAIPAALSAPAAVEAPGADAQHCAVCGQVFASRSKLFKHIEATGHAALKSAPAAPEATTSKGKKKKR